MSGLGRALIAIWLTTLAPLARAETEAAVFAGGCFWCVESDMDKVAGVVATISGYAGGTRPNPSYKSHDGYVEAVRVEFDPAVVSYERLVGYFLRTIDVTDGGGQFCDRGQGYASAIFARGARQRAAAERAVKRAAKSLGQKIATPVKPLTSFAAAEADHQDYYLGRGRVFTRFGFIRQADAYKRYRKACGRDARVREVWGGEAYTFAAADGGL